MLLRNLVLASSLAQAHLGLVDFLNLASGKVKSAYEAEGEASLAGEPPQVRAWHDAVVVAVRRNHGIELDRVQAFRLQSDGLPTSPMQFSETDEQTGSFPNDVALAMLSEGCR